MSERAMTERVASTTTDASHAQASGLVVDDLAIGYDAPIATGINLHVPRGTITALLGSSGSGKTTLLATVAGLRSPLAGRVYVDGIEVTATPIHRRGIGIVFQEPLLFTHLDVVSNVAYGLRRHGVNRATARARAHELLGWLGIADLAARRSDELSGGQAQRAALARAIAPGPGVLLLDEPFSALDIALRRRLAHELRDIVLRSGTAALHVTHDPVEAEAIADTIVTMDAISTLPA